MRRLGLTEEEKFWLRQPEHFFVPIQIALYKKHGKALESTSETLRAWMSEPKRPTWRQLELAAAEAAGRGIDPSAKALVLLDRGSVPEASYLLGRGSVTARKEVVAPGFLQVLTRGASPEEYLARARDRGRTGAGREGITDPDVLVVLGTTYRRAAMAGWLTDVDRGAGGLLAQGDRQPALAAPFRRGAGAYARRLRPDGRPARPRRAARLAGGRAGPRRLAAQADPPADRHRRGVSPGDVGGPRRSRTPRIACSGIDGRSAWRPRRSATRCSPRPAGCVGSMFGPPFRPPIPPEAIATRSKDAYPANLKDGPESWRRSVYAFVKRSVVNPFGETFDAPDTTSTCGRRNTTTVPTQNLALLNDPFVRSCAADLARRAAAEGGPEIAAARPPRLRAGTGPSAARGRAGRLPRVPRAGSRTRCVHRPLPRDLHPE